MTIIIITYLCITWLIGVHEAFSPRNKPFSCDVKILIAITAPIWFMLDLVLLFADKAGRTANYLRDVAGRRRLVRERERARLEAYQKRKDESDRHNQMLLDSGNMMEDNTSIQHIPPSMRKAFIYRHRSNLKRHRNLISQMFDTHRRI